MNYNKIFGYSLVILTLGLASCHSNKNQSEGKEKLSEQAIPAYYKYFQGTIGDKKGILQLVKSQSDANPSSNKYTGIFIDQNTGRPLTVSGKKDSTGTLTLISYVHYNPVDTFIGDFPDAGTFKGSVHDTTGQVVSFTFKENYPPAGGSYQWEVHTLADSLAFDSSNIAGPKARVNYLVLWPAKGFTTAQKRLITDTITKAYFSISNEITKANVLLRSAADTFFINYRNAAARWKKNGMGKISPSFNWVSMANTDVLWNADSLISLEYTQYEFTGGAHGRQTTTCTVFSMKQNKVLTLNDIFKPGYEKELQQILEQKLRQQYDIPDDEPLNEPGGILFKKNLALTHNFYLTGKGIGFIYNPIEVAPHYVGRIELYVPFNEISDVLKGHF